ncbi:MAG: hypothetical protein ACREOU_12335 [Candidatus Eiseniibacteriota bacterium]
MKLRMLFLPALAVAIGGCSGSVTTPDYKIVVDSRSAHPNSSLAAEQAPGGIAVDLGVGRVTRIDRLIRGRLSLDGQAPEEWEEIRETVLLSVVGTVELNGLTYAIEKQAEGEHTESENWFRQDRSGLYLLAGGSERDARTDGVTLGDAVASAWTPEVDRAVADAIESRIPDESRRAAFREAARLLRVKLEAVEAARRFVASGPAVSLAQPPGGIAPGEITFLRYPMRPGAQWDGRVGFNVWTVEGHDNLATAAGRFRAARLSIVVTDAFGPNDRALTWWGTPGETQRAYHLELDATDETGNVIGTFEFEDTYALAEYVAGGAP